MPEILPGDLFNLVQGPGEENRDLACSEIFSRELDQASYFEFSYRDLLWRSLRDTWYR